MPKHRIRREFTVFVDNLPQNLDKFGLKGIFRRIGDVSDAYIPAKLGRSRKRFGFVRFWQELDAVRSIRKLNGSTVRGSRIWVSRARFGKGGFGISDVDMPKRERVPSARKEWSIKSSHADQVKRNQKDHEVTVTMVGDKNEVFIEWLRRSIICISSVQWDLDDLSQALDKTGCSKVRAISKSKFILTYHTSDQKDEALKNKGLLENWFQEVKNWDIYETCDSRRLWIEVFGVPPHGWTLENFERIASLWGKMICLETSIEDTIYFDSMKILIVSKSFQNVMGHIVLQIGDAGYNITVREAHCSININPVFTIPNESPPAIVSREVSGGKNQPVIHNDAPASKEVDSLMIGSNGNEFNSANLVGVLPVSSSPTIVRNSISGIVGAVNLDGEVALGVDVECGYRVGVVSMDDDKGGDEGIRSPLIQIKSTVPTEDERLGDKSAASSSSQTRTRTVSFSQGRFSEECVKNTNQFGAFNGSGGIKETPLIDEALQEGQTIPGSHIKVFNMEALETGEVQSKKVENNLDPPPGFEPLLSPSCVNSEETSIPPGFEGVSRLKINTIRGRSNLKRQSDYIGKRVTRSQLKLYNNLETRSKKMLKKSGYGLGGKEGSPCANVSVETSESIRNIAEEALEIGELLGLKVVSNRENAVKRITESLKNAKVSKCNRKECNRKE